MEEWILENGQKIIWEEPNPQMIKLWAEHVPPHMALMHPIHLLIAQDEYVFSMAKVEDGWWLKAEGRGAGFFYWPVWGLCSSQAMILMLRYMVRLYPRTGRIENVHEKDKKRYEQCGFDLTLKAYEYVYRREEIAHYPGQRFKSQRHDVHRVMKHQQLREEKLRPNHLSWCASIYERWAKHKAFSSRQDALSLSMVEDNRIWHQRIIAAMDAQGLAGLLFFDGDNPVAYSLGYPLNRDTVVVLLEIADPAVKGLGAYVFSRICQDERFNKFTFVNAMDDAGLAALSAHKKQYHPVEINPLYNATIRG